LAICSGQWHIARLVRVSDGAPLGDLTEVANQGALQYLSVSPDGKFVGSSGNAVDSLRNASDGASVRDIHPGPPVTGFAFSPDRSLFVYTYSNAPAAMIITRVSDG